MDTSQGNKKLGFLSLTTFITTKTALFHHLNDKLFEEEDELLEIVEMVHFALFFLIVYYILHVLVFLRHASRIEFAWSNMDHMVSNRGGSGGEKSTNSGTDILYRADKEQLLFENNRELLSANCGVKSNNLDEKSLKHRYFSRI